LTGLLKLEHLPGRLAEADDTVTGYGWRSARGAAAVPIDDPRMNA
jgi:hypothetical protein